MPANPTDHSLAGRHPNRWKGQEPGGGGGGPTTVDIAYASPNLTATVNGVSDAVDLDTIIAGLDVAQVGFGFDSPKLPGSGWTDGEPLLWVHYASTGGPTGEGQATWQIVQDGALNGGTPGVPSWSLPGALLTPNGSTDPTGTPAPNDRLFINSATQTLWLSDGTQWVRVGLTVADEETHTPDPGADPSFFPLISGGRQAVADMSPVGSRSAGRIVDGELHLPPLPFSVFIDGSFPISFALPGGLTADRWNFPFVADVPIANPLASASVLVTRPVVTVSWQTDATNLSICPIITDWGDASLIPATSTFEPDLPGAWFDLDPAFQATRRDTLGGFTDAINPSPSGTDWVNGHVMGWNNGAAYGSATLRVPVGVLLPGQTQNLKVVLAVGVPAVGTTGTEINGDISFTGFACQG